VVRGGFAGTRCDDLAKVFIEICRSLAQQARRLPTLTGMDSYDSERIARLERQVDYLARYLGIDPALIADGALPPGAPGAGPTGFGVAPADELADVPLAPVYDALSRNKKIEAVKLYRELTGVGLADAKRAVDLMARGR
jgi:ribosomal protein L7/L12